MKNRVILIIFSCLLTGTMFAQERAVVFGTVADSVGQPIELANISVMGSGEGTMTNERGTYEFTVPSGRNLTVVISCVGYESQQTYIALEPGERKKMDIRLKQDVTSLEEISVSARQDKATTFQRINVDALTYMPSTTGSLEAIIKSQAGVSSNNELSSQYSVRGGNFDENLVYVNDIEIYRPFLVRSGEQEGLSFVNSDLVSSIRFSAGGFDARYGDKMSSALDITYRRPEKFGGSASVSLLGASAHIEGASRNNRLSFLLGYRYKTTSYLLNSLETEGDYNPQFSDLQGLISYRFSERVELSFLGNYSSNSYQFTPETRETKFGTQQLPFNFRIYYEGQEVDKFETWLGALSLDIRPTDELELKFIGSGFQTIEQETFDILGQYLINELDNTVGSETYGDSILNIGVGSLLNHARNYLDAYVLSLSHIGTLTRDNYTLKWGLKYQYQDFYDRVSEWEMVDSAGYSLPYNGSEIGFESRSRATNRISYDQVTSFVQNTWEFSQPAADYFITAGIRGALWNFNRTFMLSPRFTVGMEPHWQRDMMFKFSGGYYYQPPFYKEMRMPDDRINENIRPQRSIHLLLGGDYIFSVWNRPFKLTTEIYYKWLDDLIPYKIENVRIRYAGENIAKGYATGIDFKLNGEFVRGAESWFTASLMQTREDIQGDSVFRYVDGEKIFDAAGYYSRPTEQIFSAGVYFQDYLPNNPDYKVQLSAFFGTGLPLSHPDEDQYFTEFRMRPYRRVDIGFSKVLKRENAQLGEKNPFRHFKNIWVSAEIFNLLGINNEASAIWVKTLTNQQGIPGSFAVPNYLTGRRFNVKLSAKF